MREQESTAEAGGAVEFSVLGPLDVRHHGRPIELASTPGRALLGYLATESGRAHSREQLATLLWPDHSQQAAYANLRQTLARLRRLVPSDLELSRLVTVSGRTVALAGGPATTDLALFDELVAVCRDHLPAHPDQGLAGCSECRDRLGAALALHRGELLSELHVDSSEPFEDWLRVRREEVRRQRVAVVEALMERETALGDAQAALGHALTLVDLDPLREAAHRAAMRAWDALGDRSAALAQFEQCRAILSRELGLEPGAETVALRQAISERTSTAGDRARQRPVAHPDGAVSTDPAAPGAEIPGPVPAPARHNLPGDLTPFVGREEELKELTELVGRDGVRLVTLTGMGGMGKTRLAVELARYRLDYLDDGVFLVPLAPLSAPADIVPSIAAAVGISINAGDPHRSGDARLALLSGLRPLHALLVLDNFEHLLEGAELVDAILRAAPRLQVVVTSRERLHLQGEQIYPVGGLPYASAIDDHGNSPAVRLFAQAARRVDPTFVIDAATTVAVTDICRLVDGMPLGLELAAAWIESLTTTEVVEEIRRSLDFLAVEWSNLPERQRSIRAVFDSSWRLLDDNERRAFRQLSVFRGGFSREAAQAVAGAPLPILAQLGRKALLYRPVPGPHGGAGRYQSHELLRQFAAEQLERSGEEGAAVAARHAAWCLDLAETASPLITGADQAEMLERLDQDHDNLRAALGWAASGGQRELGLRLGVALWPFWQRRCHLAEGRRWFDQFLPPVDSRGHPVAGPGPDGVGTGLELLADAYLGAAWLGHDQDDFARADALFNATLHLEEALGTTVRTAAVLAHRGVMARGQGRYREGIDLLEQSLNLARRAGDDQATAYALFRLGLVTREHGEYQRAADAYTECLDLYQRIGDRSGAAFAVLGLGDLARDQGDHEGVVTHCRASLAITRELRRDWGIGFTLNNLALAALERGDPDDAADHAREALALFRAHGIGGGVLEVLVTSAQVALARGRRADAGEYLAEALDVGWPAGPLWLVATAVEERTRLIELEGGAELAVRLSAAAGAWRSAMEAPVPPYRVGLRRELVGRLAETLGPRRFDAVWAEGASWTPEEAVAAARP